MRVDWGRVVRLVDALLEQPSPGNWVLSPVGFCNGLEMARQASAGRTRAEFDALLPDGPWLNGSVTPANPLRTANMILTASGGSTRAGFADQLMKRSDSRVFDVTSAAGREAAERWVSDRTGRAVDLSRYSRLGAMPPAVATLVTVNKLDVRWRSPFNPISTSSAPFHRADGSRSTVRMMHKTGPTVYGEMPWGETVMLELEAGLEAYFVLPTSGHDPCEAARMTVRGLLQTRLQLRLERIHLGLPRFSGRSGGDACGALQALGLDAVFTPGQADLSAGFATPGLHLGPVSHAAMISVDENGVRAESQLDIPAFFRGEKQEIRLDFDRPFALVLWDPRLRTIPFVACIADPEPVD